MSVHEPQKLLFCLANNKIGGGNRVLMEIANRQKELGSDVSIAFVDGSTEPRWFANSCPIVNLEWHGINTRAGSLEQVKGIRKTDQTQPTQLTHFDCVFVSNISLVPALFDPTQRLETVLVCQGFEPYCYGETLSELFQPKPAIEEVFKLPFAIISTSKSIHSLLQTKLGRASYLVPVAIDETQFVQSENQSLPQTPKRILAVGDYLATFKGIFDIANALELLHTQFPVELVLLTQQESGREKFSQFSFPVEFHCRPAQTELARLYASCDVYCCGSWYEGFGLPCLESFSVGLPVISTKNLGVSEFADDEKNMLLAETNSPESIASALSKILTNDGLRTSLIENARQTSKQYNWSKTMSAFGDAVQTICAKQHTVEVESSPDQTTSEHLSQLLLNLEENGYYTPPSVEQALKHSSAALADLIENAATNSIDDATEAKAKLFKLRDEFKRHLTKPKAHYYKQFKARFDFCQLLSICNTPADWQKFLKQKSNRAVSPTNAD